MKAETTLSALHPRMKNPAEIIPDAVQPIQALYASAYKGGVPPATLALAHLRISQINRHHA